MDLQTLRNMRSNTFNKISAEMDRIVEPNKGFDDERFWKLEVDKAGNGTAIIRFLPGTDPVNEVPWVRLFSHGFQGPSGKWYIENSRTSIEEEDPVNLLAAV